MKTCAYRIEYAGHILTYSFLHVATKYSFRNFIRGYSELPADIVLSIEQMEYARSLLPLNSKDHYIEFKALVPITAKELLKYHCCIFHAVSFIWQGRAWLLTAPSGTGKTTQYQNWQKLFPGEITMISGDMPVLEVKEDGAVWVHPSPWNGKENIGNTVIAPLKGVVLLEQGEENFIVPLSAEKAVMPLLMQFIVRPDTEDEIRSLTGILDQMLRTVPVWKMTNRGDADSTILLRKTIEERCRTYAEETNGDL